MVVYTIVMYRLKIGVDMLNGMIVTRVHHMRQLMCEWHNEATAQKAAQQDKRTI